MFEHEGADTTPHSEPDLTRADFGPGPANQDSRAQFCSRRSELFRKSRFFGFLQLSRSVVQARPAVTRPWRDSSERAHTRVFAFPPTWRPQPVPMELLLLVAAVAGSVGWLAHKVSRWRAASRRRGERAAQQRERAAAPDDAAQLASRSSAGGAAAPGEQREEQPEGARKRARDDEALVPRRVPPPQPPFRGPAADSALGERFVDVLPLVAARGYAAEASQALWLCGETWRRGDRGATNDMIVSSLRLQCGAAQARKAVRERFTFADPLWDLATLKGTTQLIRASIQNNLPRVLQLIQLGAPLDLVDQSNRPRSAMHWASRLGHEHVVAALLEGKFKGADVEQVCDGYSTLEQASSTGHVGVVRVLLARGAKQVRLGQIFTAMLSAVIGNHIEVVKLLLAAPGASDSLKKKDTWSGTPLTWAINYGLAEIEALLRVAGAE